MADGAMLENIRNPITRLTMDLLGRKLGGRIPWQRRTGRSYGRLEAECVNQF